MLLSSRQVNACDTVCVLCDMYNHVVLYLVTQSESPSVRQYLGQFKPFESKLNTPDHSLCQVAMPTVSSCARIAMFPCCYCAQGHTRTRQRAVPD